MNDQITEGLYYGDLLKYAIFLGKGCLEVLKMLDINPDIVHFHDALSALACIYAKNDPFYMKEFSGVKFAFTIHNAGPAYQQIFPSERVKELNIPTLNWDKVIWKGNLNLMYAGLINSDICNTVSEDYAVTLRTEGEGMVEVFRSKKIFGILNGIDIDYWRDDIYKGKNIDEKKLVELKKKKKEELINEIYKRCGKKLSKHKLIVVMPRRLSGQKGFDTIYPIIPDACKKLKFQFIMLGVAHPKDEIGKKWAEDFRKLSEELREFVFIYAFDEKLAKLMYAGGDLILYPSLPNKEPCGTGYMMAMVNATPCLGTKTGGLAECIQEFDEVLETGNGFLVWKEEYSPRAFFEKFKKISKLYYRKKSKWNKLMWNSFNSNFDIKEAAKKYILKVYLPLTEI